MTNYNVRKKLRDENKKSYSEYRNDKVTEQFRKDLETHCKTIFVGAIAKIESYFGSLWGEDSVDEEKMTEEQKKWYEAFMDAREEIFDQGNEQLQNLINKFIHYANKHTITMKKDNNNG